jgi:hypothetical protein
MDWKKTDSAIVGTAPNGDQYRIQGREKLWALRVWNFILRAWIDQTWTFASQAEAKDRAEERAEGK